MAPLGRSLVDPRVAAKGGTRRDPKSGFDYPGMMSERHWRVTPAHQHTHSYGCAWCSVKFKGPHALYTHLAKVHGR